ncbi:hypothetical protein [Stutzerimonas kunmingensis]|uniref:hypothetical protein n=1 Tax=Stutzerimonas kunmingensis TaxID=1211807 RepID=UPI002FCBD6CA
MIWALTNIWWLVPVAIGLLALLNPTTALLLRKVPRRVWLALGAVALLGLTFQAGRWYERRAQEAKQATAEARADRKAIKAGARADKAADEAVATIKEETDHAADRARVIVREITADCPLPAQPDELRRIGDEAVGRARRAL